MTIESASKSPPDQTGDTGENVLVADEVTKRFGGLVAVKSVNMTIKRGMIYSLIGPNGAGKTTFFNVIAGILPPTSGHVTINGNGLIAPSRRPWIEPLTWFIPGRDHPGHRPAHRGRQRPLPGSLGAPGAAGHDDHPVDRDGSAALLRALSSGFWASSATRDQTMSSAPGLGERSRTSGCSRT